VIGHLGTRVSALLDGQLSARDTEEAWEHVYACHACRDLVEREGWVKTRLAGLCTGEREAPSGLKGSLMSMPPGDALLAGGSTHAQRRPTGAVVIGGGAVGAALLGVVAFGLAGSTPVTDRRPPVTQINTSVPSSPATPATGGSGPGATYLPGAPVPIRRMLP
jgi:hypothetical protein